MSDIAETNIIQQLMHLYFNNFGQAQNIRKLNIDLYFHNLFEKWYIHELDMSLYSIISFIFQVHMSSITSEIDRQLIIHESAKYSYARVLQCYNAKHLEICNIDYFYEPEYGNGDFLDETH